MNSPESEKNPPKLNKATIDILIGVVIFTVIVALLMHRYLPKDERTAGTLAIVSMGITICAFLPQLMTNFLNKSRATDPVLAIFLIMAAVGVLLRIPALRQSLGLARGQNKGILLALLISIWIYFSGPVHRICCQENYGTLEKQTFRCVYCYRC